MAPQNITGAESRVIAGSASFPCPKCGETMFRPGAFREQAVAYECTCGFQGP